MSTQLPKFGSRDSHPTVPKHVTSMHSTRYVHPQTQSAGTVGVGVCTYNHVDGIGAASYPPLTSIDFAHCYPKSTEGIGLAVLYGYLLCGLYLLTVLTRDVAAQGSHSEQLLNLQTQNTYQIIHDWISRVPHTILLYRGYGEGVSSRG
jgi:hypothetical protein